MTAQRLLRYCLFLASPHHLRYSSSPPDDRLVLAEALAQHSSLGKRLSSRRSILANLGRCLSEVKTGPLLYFGAIEWGEGRGQSVEGPGMKRKVSGVGFQRAGLGVRCQRLRILTETWKLFFSDLKPDT